MLIIFNTRIHFGKTIPLDSQCPVCGAKHAIETTPYQEYVCFFWIPSIPQKKKFIIKCTECGSSFSENEIFIDKAIRKNIKTPKWMLSGIFLISFLFIISASYMALDERKSKLATKAFITEPHIGDIYEIKNVDSITSFTLMKVLEISNDSVSFLFHEYEVLEKSSLYSLKKPPYRGKFIDTISYKYSKTELTKAFEEKMILKVER